MIYFKIAFDKVEKTQLEYAFMYTFDKTISHPDFNPVNVTGMNGFKSNNA